MSLPGKRSRNTRRKKKPLPLGERLFRVWRDVRAGWPLYLGLALYGLVLILTAIDPLVDPFMPERGRSRIIAAIPLSYRLLDGGLWQHALFGLVWLPWVALLLWLPRFPRWLRDQREWERRAIIRRARDKQRRARQRAEREALSSGGESDAPDKS